MGYIKKLEKAVTNNFYEEKNQVGKKILSKEMNQMLFKQIKGKYENAIFQNQMGTVGSLIVKGEERFCKLSLSEQCCLLIEIIKYFDSKNSVGANMISIEGKAKSVVLSMNKKISNNYECILVQQSPTGLFQKEIDLLTV